MKVNLYVIVPSPPRTLAKINGSLRVKGEKKHELWSWPAVNDDFY